MVFWNYTIFFLLSFGLIVFTGDAPLVIARGGYSGLFPDSSQFAYQFALSTSLSDVVLFCDLQLTKDGAGFCHSGLQLDNSTTISQAFPKGQKTYPVNGEDVTGWFAIDYVSKVLFDKVSCMCLSSCFIISSL